MKRKATTWRADDIISHDTDFAVYNRGERGWKRVSTDGKRMIFSENGQTPLVLEIRIPLKGRHAVTIGTYATLPGRTPGTVFAHIGVIRSDDNWETTYNVLPQRSGFGSSYLGVFNLDGSGLKIGKLSRGAVGITRVSFEKTKEPNPRFNRDSVRKSPIIYGISDQNDFALEILSDRMGEQMSGIRKHVELGFNTMSWHMYLGCCEYPTKVGTTFPYVDLNDREHLRILSQSSQPIFDIIFRNLIHACDCMEEGTSLSHQAGLTFMPCLRMNNEWFADWAREYGRDEFLQKFWCPEFFNKHPEYWSQYKNGKHTGGGMDYSHAAVRKYRLAIVREIMENYPRIDGMFLDLHRHPNMVTYPDKVVNAFKKKYGIDVRKVQPINEETMDPRWLKFRARWFTDFMRSVKRTKQALGKRYPTVVRTERTFAECMREGADLEAWFKEGLVDWLILENRRDENYDVSLEPVIKEAAKAGVKVLGGFPDCAFVMRSRWSQIAKIAGRWLEQGASGVAFYESNSLVLDNNVRRNMPGWVRSLG